MKPGSVIIGYVHGGVVENAFMESLVGLLGYDAKHANRIVDVKGCEGLYIADNRDRVCRQFMRADAEWLWFIDTDIAFPPDTLDALLACADPVERPIMSALYFGYMSDGGKLVPVWYGRDEKDGRITHLTKFDSSVQRIGVAGMGCCLIHRSVFEKFGDKYAHTGWLYFGHDLAPWVPTAAIDNDFTPFGEDNCFCHRCNELGIPIYGNGSIVVEHRKKRYESLQTFLASFGKTTDISDGAHLKLVREPAVSGSESEAHREARNGSSGHSNNGIASAAGIASGLRSEPDQSIVHAAESGMVESDDLGHEPGPQTGSGVGLGELASTLQGRDV